MRLTLNQRPEEITKARKNARLTKTALAAAVERSLSLISEIEGGTRNAQPDLLVRIAAVLKVPVERLSACEPGGTTAEAADVDVPDLRNAQRSSAVSDGLPERGRPEQAPAAREVK